MSPKESNPLLPISTLRSSPASFDTENTSAQVASLKAHAEPPHKLLGIACVAASAVCFSLMSTFLKYNTFSMTSMEAIFWRSLVALVFNYVRALAYL